MRRNRYENVIKRQLWTMLGATMLALGIGSTTVGAAAAPTSLAGGQEAVRALHGPATGPTLTIDDHGQVFVAWSQNGAVYKSIVVARMVDDQLELLGPDAGAGGVNGSVGDATAPSLAINAAGQPTVAWEDGSDGNHEIYLRAWNGSAWEARGLLSSRGGVSRTRTGHSSFPKLVFDPRGVATLAWEERFASRSDIYVRQVPRAGTEPDLVDLGEQAGLTGFPSKLSAARQPALASSAQGLPTVAWIDDELGRDAVYLLQWTGRRWIELDRSGLGYGVNRSPHTASSVGLRLDAQGRPVLSWREGARETARVRVVRWADDAWRDVGESAAEPAAEPVWPALALDAEGRPLIAYRSRDRVVWRRWTGSDWQTIAGFDWQAAPAYTLPDRRMLAFDARAGKACAVWLDVAPRSAVRVACRAY